MFFDWKKETDIFFSFQLNKRNEEENLKNPKTGRSPRRPHTHTHKQTKKLQVLPDSLSDALAQAGAATADALASGGPGARALVELLLPDLWDPASGAVFAEEGDQQRFWKLTRRYAEELVASSPPGTRVRALYPDAGVAAMLKSQWGGGGGGSDKGRQQQQELAFDIAAITDREPARAGTDDVVVLAAPDPQSLAAAVKAADAARDAGIPCVMFNPRLVSGDVGIGLNVRRLRDGFLATFATAYALRPVGEVGTVYKRWPGKWQVFVEDERAPGRYKLAGNGEGFDAAPAGEALDLIFSQALSSSSSSSGGAGGASGFGGGGGPRVDPTDDAQIGIGERVGSVVRGLQRFMKQLSQ